MSTPHPLAGKPAPSNILIDAHAIEKAFFEKKPDISNPAQLVSFGTSGHRGTSINGSFTEAHVAAITQATCEYRKKEGITGPLFVGMDTHLLSRFAQETALEVLAGNEVEALYQEQNGFTPTPVISSAIIRYNKGRSSGLADGLIITPSHNPPQDAGIKYNPPQGGPADTEITSWIQKRANELLEIGATGIKRRNISGSSTVSSTDFLHPFVESLSEVLNLTAIKESGISIGVDPLGGASLAYWEPIATRWGLKITVVNKALDPTFKFMSVDHDGQIRMDCSSPYAMASLLTVKDSYDVACGCDPDADRHGIVTRSRGLLNPNHYLALAIDYLLSERKTWPQNAAVGKTLVSSVLIDRVVASHKRKLYEVPVGFKWFAPGLADGSLCFGGEESAGASLLKKDGTAWSTDKDGITLALLAAEITAVRQKELGEQLTELQKRFGETSYTRVDSPLTAEKKKRFSKLTVKDISINSLGGEPVTAILDSAPGNGKPIGGFKITTQSGWVAMRPSGTEPILKVYGESFKSDSHLKSLIADIVSHI